MTSIFANIVNHGHQDDLLLPTNVLSNYLKNLNNLYKDIEIYKILKINKKIIKPNNK